MCIKSNSNHKIFATRHSSTEKIIKKRRNDIKYKTQREKYIKHQKDVKSL